MTFSVTPKLIINDCSHAVEQRPMQISVANLDLGWHELQRIDEQNFGRHFQARHALHVMPDSLELLIIETIQVGDERCDSVYSGILQ